MPELPELTVVQEILHNHILGQTIVSAEVIPPGGPIVVRDLTCESQPQRRGNASDSR